MIYDITPVPKPRQNRADKWLQRPPVMRYRAFADECRLKGVKLPLHGACVTFYMPMPKSWSKAKKSNYEGKPHKQRPDLDNIAKALFDALFEDDSHIWNIRITKRWSYEGAIQIL